PQGLQCIRSSLTTHRITVAAEAFPPGNAFTAGSGKSKPDGADRLLFTAAIRPGDTTNRHGIISTSRFQCAYRHFHHDGFTHRAMLRQRLFAYADHLRFGFVTVGDKSAFKPRGATGNIGNHFRYATT